MKNNTYKAVVNNQFEFPDLTSDDLDIIAEQNGHFHILSNNVAYRAEVVSADFDDKLFVIKVNGSPYEVRLEDHYDLLVKKLGLSKNVQYKVKEVKAPMPGLVVNVNVEAGQTVQRGDALLILEAMKMENVIKSPGGGVVKSVFVIKGEAVEKGHLLIEME